MVDAETPPPVPPIPVPPRLWNPIAAAWWSLVFSPAFGSFLHRGNWRAVGDRPRARANLLWFFATLLLIFVVLPLVPFFSSFAFRVVITWGLFGVWYASQAQAQIKYVKTLPNGYRKRPIYVPMLVVLAVIALAIGVPAVINQQLARSNDVAKKILVYADIQGFTSQLRLYESLNEFLPTTEQGLQALVSEPTTDPRPTHWYQLLKTIPQDPWQHRYIYRCPGLKNPDGFDLFSSGPDGQPDTADDVWGK